MANVIDTVGDLFGLPDDEYGNRKKRPKVLDEVLGLTPPDKRANDTVEIKMGRSQSVAPPHMRHSSSRKIKRIYDRPLRGDGRPYGISRNFFGQADFNYQQFLGVGERANPVLGTGTVRIGPPRKVRVAYVYLYGRALDGSPITRETIIQGRNLLDVQSQAREKLFGRRIIGAHYV